jgi:redox-sensitive bicupin YhaK (pirin superfamily)
MEIFTYIISGELEHKDSMGNGRVIKSGEFQYMSAGEGIMHSEANPSSDEEVHLLQIWITPNHPGGDPRYADMDTNALKTRNGLSLFASGNGRDGSQAMRQTAEIFFGQLDQNESIASLPDGSFEHHYLHLISGSLQMHGHSLEPGDAVMIDGNTPAIQAKRSAEFLYFNL